MSCYVCAKETWLTILKGMIKHNIISTDEVQGFYKELVTLNYKSVASRYGDDEEPPKDEIELTPAEIMTLYSPVSDDKIYEAIKEYQYQSCDCDDYYKYEGYYMCDWLKDAMLRIYLGIDF